MLATRLLVLLGLASTALAQFGLTDESDSFVVNAGSANPLVVTIRKSDCDIRSIVYRGTELQGPQAMGTHIGSGLGTATVTAQTIDGMFAAFWGLKYLIRSRFIHQGHLRSWNTYTLHRRSLGR